MMNIISNVKVDFDYLLNIYTDVYINGFKKMTKLKKETVNVFKSFEVIKKRVILCSIF